MVARTAGAGLRRLPLVAMMQATDFGNLHDPARLGELDGPDVRRMLVEREVRASPMIVGEVLWISPARSITWRRMKFWRRTGGLSIGPGGDRAPGSPLCGP